MGNAAGAKASREEEIAFLAMEEVLGVEIELADAGLAIGSQTAPGSAPKGTEDTASSR